MPELPEVETVRRQLRGRLPGRRVESVRVLLPRLLQNIEPEQFVRRVNGRTFADIERRGKFLLLHMDGDAEGDVRLIIHLRMTGRLLMAAATAEEEPYTRLVFDLDGGYELRFADMRTFGTLHYIGPGYDESPPGLLNMGPEPLVPEFTPAVLHETLAGRRAAVKAVLLDQRRVAGLGNIYVDEALYLSGIHPTRPAGRVTKEEAALLHHNIRKVLREALAAGGTTIRDYVDGEGEAGTFQHRLHAYGRAGTACERCGATFVRLRVAGRGSHVCPACQK